MNQIGCYLVLLALLGGILFLLSKKYGFKTAAISVVVSGVLAFVTFKVIFAYSMESMNQSLDEPTNWHQVTDVDNEGKVNGLEYKPELGIFALTENEEIKVADTIPTCLPDGEVAVNLSPDTYAELTQTPRLEISTFTDNIVQQLFFDIVYPIGADELGVSSYVLDENGEVWCSEIYARGGVGGGSAAGFGAFLVAVPIFALAIFVFLISLAVVILIMRRSTNSAT